MLVSSAMSCPPLYSTATLTIFTPLTHPDPCVWRSFRCVCSLFLLLLQFEETVGLEHGKFAQPVSGGTLLARCYSCTWRLI